MLLSAIVVMTIATGGFGLTSSMSARLRFEERVAIGIVVGAIVTSIVSFVAFLVIGMGSATLLIGVGVPVCGGFFSIRRHRSELGDDLRSAGRRLQLPCRDGRSLRPLAAITAASLAVTTRILSLAYQTTPQGLSAGSLATWSDWSAHLAYASSFAYGDNRQLDLPIATGIGFRYHFLSDFFGSLFTVSGATLPQGLVISEWMLAVALPPLLWCMVMRLTRSRLTAGSTVLFFTLSGGVGLWYFARDVTNDGWGIVTRLPQTYARMPDLHLWVDNTISASLYAQRSTLMGLCAAFSAAIVVLASRPSWNRRGFVAAGLLIGLSGIAHAHSLLTALALAGLAFIVDRRRTRQATAWLWFIVPAAVIGLPMAWAISPETNSIRWLLGWMAPQSDQSWPWFWFRNVGLLLPLFVGIALLGGVAPRLRRITAPLWLWFVVPNLTAFHPWEWNNTKYFLFWQLAGCLLIASWLSRAFGTVIERRPTMSRSLLQVGAVLIALLSISAGGLDTLRAMQRSSAIPWVDHDDLAAAEWLRDNSSAEDVIVYGMSNTSAVAALGGRRAVSGYPGWTFDLGLPDWSQRWSNSLGVLTGDDTAAATIETHGVDWVVIGPIERNTLGASDAYWEQNGTLAFSQGEYRIYATG